MKILLCNPKNSQGTKHSRKGMYAPLGILSIATYLKQNLGDDVHINVCDEDVRVLKIESFQQYDLVGFYSTTFNYDQAVQYAYFAKEYGCITVLGGPHPSVLARNIINNRSCFDFIIMFEAELPFLKLVQALLLNKRDERANIPNLVFKNGDGKINMSKTGYENSLEEVPIPSREFIDCELYIRNYQNIYSDKINIRPGSIYSSKGCSWRDKTGGCVFCARLERGVRFRNIDQIWSEIKALKDSYNINTIWDISDDNLNSLGWFKEFVRRRPSECKDMNFFIYSRVNFIKEEIVKYFKELNVQEVFLGVESGDNRVLRNSFKGQTDKSALRACRILSTNGIKYFPSFVLGLPGESEESLTNTYRLCEKFSELGGLERISTTILKPIPGSPAFDKIVNNTKYGKDLASMDSIDLAFLERYWIGSFTSVSYDTILEFKNKIDTLMEKFYTFGSSVSNDN